MTKSRTKVRDTNAEFEENLSFGQRMADRVAAFGGSWAFIGLFSGVLLVWIVFNMSMSAAHRRSFDPYPFILLNLVLSTLAALQAPVIMMSQNRQSAKDRLDAKHDYEINVKAETEIEELRAHIAVLQENIAALHAETAELHTQVRAVCQQVGK